MKKILSTLLVLVLTLSSFSTIYASEEQPYEYILPMEYTSIRQARNDLIVAYDTDGKCALYDMYGTKLLDGYDMISENFNFHGITYGKRGDTTDIINMQGTVLSSHNKKVLNLGDYVMVNLSDENNDGRPLHYYEGEFGVYDYMGNLRKTFNYDSFRKPKTWTDGISFAHGRLIFNENEKYGAFDDNFNVAIPPEFDRIFPFQSNWDRTIAIKNGKYGIIDSFGNTVADFIYDYIEPINRFSDYPTGYKVQKDGLYGALSADGTNLIKAFDGKEPFAIYNNYSLISVILRKLNSYGNYDNVYGVIDFDGNIIVPIENGHIKSISEGLIGVCKAYEQCGYYDWHGNPITDLKYDIISPFSDGLAFTYKSGEQTSDVINPDGEVVFRVNGDSGNGFEDGMAFIGDGKFVDTHGNVIVGDEKWITAEKFDCPFIQENMYIVYDADKDKYGLVKFKSKQSEPLWDYEYVDFENTKTFRSTENGYVFTLLDGTEIYLDKNGNVTDDAVGVSGYNIFYKDDIAILKDNNNKTIAEYSMDKHSFSDEEKYICVTSHESTNGCFRIYSKENGELLLDAKSKDFQNEYVYINDNDTFAFINSEKKYGIADIKGNIILKPEYDKILPMGNDFVVKKDGKQNILDYTGNLMIELETSETANKIEGTEKYTMINGKSVKILDENYKLIHNFGEGYTGAITPCGIILLRNQSKNTMYAAKKNGEIIIPEKEHEIAYLQDGLFEVSDSNSRSLYNIEGKRIASAYMGLPRIGDNGLIGISQDGFEGYIDKNGIARITLPNGYYVHGAFSEGVAPVVKNIVYSRYGEVSYINEQGEIVIESNDKTWCSGGDFRNGLFSVGTILGKAGPQAQLLVRCLYDTPSDWAKETIDNAVKSGLVNEQQQKRYRRNITREDFCEIAYNLPKIKNACEQLTGVVDNFTDTDNEKILQLCALGIINGVGDNKFSPDTYITREESATILERIMNKTIDNISMTTDYIMFDDDNEISDWAKNSIQVVAHFGIIQGVGDNKIAPKETYTTEQAIATIFRVFNYR